MRGPGPGRRGQQAERDEWIERVRSAMALDSVRPKEEGLRRIQDLCAQVTTNRATNGQIKTLLGIVLAPWATPPLPATDIENICSFPGWPDFLPKINSERANRAGYNDSAARDPLDWASYLYLFWLLSRAKHPLLVSEGAKGYLGACRAYEGLKDILELRDLVDDTEPHSSLEMAAGLFAFLGPLPPTAASSLAATTLLSLPPAKEGEERRVLSRRDVGGLRMGAIRYGSTGQFVFSEMQLNLIGSSQASGPDRIVVSVNSNGADGDPAAFGFYTLLGAESYFILRDAFYRGLHIANVPFSQLRRSDYAKGLMLTIDNKAHEHALAARMIISPYVSNALLTNKDDSDPKRSDSRASAAINNGVTANEVRRALCKTVLADSVEEILQYLRGVGKIAVLGSPEGDSPEIISWREIKSLLRDEAEAKRLGVGEENELSGYLKSALTVE